MEEFTHISLNEYCSNHFICEQCLREEKAKVKAYTRYDSLCLCFIHNQLFNINIMQPLRKIFKDANAKVYNKLI